MARIISVGSALQDVYLIDRDDLSTDISIQGHSYFDCLELGVKIDIDRVEFSTGGGATNAATTLFLRAMTAFWSISAPVVLTP